MTTEFVTTAVPPVVYEPGVQDLIGAMVSFTDTEHDVSFVSTSGDWSLKIDLDAEAEELIFEASVDSNHWLAVALADNYDDADVI